MHITTIEKQALNGIKEAFENELREALAKKLDAFLEGIRTEYMEEIENTVDNVSKRVDLAFYKDLTTPVGPPQPFLRWILNDIERTKQHEGDIRTS